eukprot:GILK01005971.1.p1 GENE.GILK01005971.1~~GILK01005971.1.p1  ORF type:complete len:304 (-),score=45.86 GILK01005971.1:136-1047(-)
MSTRQLVSLLSLLLLQTAIAVHVGTHKTHLASSLQQDDLNNEEADRVQQESRDVVSVTRTKDTFLLLGDSLTQTCFEDGSWISQLGHAYSEKVDIICRGVGGYNSRNLLLSLDTVLPSLNGAVPSLITIFIGANDAVLSSSEPQFIHVDEYKQNLVEMINRLKNYAKDQAATKPTHIILITPPPIHEAKRAMSCQGTYNPETDRSDENAHRYGLAMKEVAQSMGVFCINLWEQMHAQGGDNYGDYLSDGLHFTSSGQTLLARSLLAFIQENIKELVPAVDTDAVHAQTMSVDVPEGPEKEFDM